MKIKLFMLVFIFVSFPSFAWTLLPGAARDVAEGWIIGTDYGIYRWDGSEWTRIYGGAERIGGTYSNPWVVNQGKEIFRWTGSAWEIKPGFARDVADGWIIGTQIAKGGYEIYRWNYLSSSWKKMPGGAIKIGGTYNNPWIVNNVKKIFRWTGTKWDLVQGQANDVGDGWIIGTKKFGSGYEIFRWDGLVWSQVFGGAVSIGGAGGPPWVVNSAAEIFRW